MRSDRTCATCVFSWPKAEAGKLWCAYLSPVEGHPDLSAEVNKTDWCGRHRTEAEFEAERMVEVAVAKVYAERHDGT